MDNMIIRYSKLTNLRLLWSRS